MTQLSLIIAIGLAMLAVGSSCAQTYPAKPVRILTGEPGGGVDIMTRQLAPVIAASTGQATIVDNRPGIVAIETAMKAPADGYTLLLYGNLFWLTPFLQEKASYHPTKDFAPISSVANFPYIVVVHPSSAFKSVKELIDAAKAKPGALNYASGNTASGSHLTAELFKAKAGVNIVRIPYKGTGPAVNAVVANEVSLMFSTPGSVLVFTKSGRLRALAVTSAKPSLLAPGVPTATATGLPGFEVGSATGIFAPAKVPAAIIARVNLEIVRALNQLDIKEKFLNSGYEAVPSTPGELAALVKADMTTVGKLIQDAGIRPD